MKREKWYIINRVASGGVVASTSIDGIRIQDTQLYPASIVPGDWFKDVTRQYETLIFGTPEQGGRHVALPYSPDTDEYNILYTVFPASTPSREFKQVTEDKPHRTKWYRVPDNKHIPVGIQALCDVEGVCTAGDVAGRGEIIPVQWLSGLTMAQINRLCDTGITSLKQLESYGALARRIPTTPVLETYKPDPAELDSLYLRYPGASPDYMPEIINVEESSKE